MLIASLLNGRFANYLTGLSAAASVAGIDVTTWDPTKRTAEEAYEDLQPDILLLDSDFCEPNETCRSLNKLPCKKVVVGDLLNTTLDYDLFASVNPFPNFQRAYHLKMAANAAQYNRPEFDRNLVCDVAVLGDRLGSLQRIVDKLTEGPKQGENSYRVRIHTTEPTYHKEYVGVLSHKERRNLFGAAGVILTDDEQTAWDAAFNGGLPLGGFWGILGHPCRLTTEDVRGAILERTEGAVARQKAVATTQKNVGAAHTYFHRLHDIFTLLSLPAFDPNRIVKGLL